MPKFSAGASPFILMAWCKNLLRTPDIQTIAVLILHLIS